MPNEVGPDGWEGKNVNNADLVLRGWVSREDFGIGRKVFGFICKAAFFEKQSQAECWGRAKVSKYKPPKMRKWPGR